MDRRIVIMAGGTGGHVFPALAVALQLREKNWRVSWIGTRRGLEARVVPENGIIIDWVDVGGLRGNSWLAKIKAPLMLVKACLQTLTILKRRQPNVVLGMGGFVAGPGGLMAWLLRIPLVIHEQNRVPGTTNRILAKFANRVLEAFPGSFAENINATWTGNPLRKDISSLGAAAHSAGNRIKVLVVGGSLGAQVLNEIVPEAAALIDKLEIKHQTGKDLFDQVKTG